MMNVSAAWMAGTLHRKHLQIIPESPGRAAVVAQAVPTALMLLLLCFWDFWNRLTCLSALAVVEALDV
jgi:hypothetical protein